MSQLSITIFHTNDIHGRVEAMSRLSHYARRLKADAEAQGRLVFLWDAGDVADRREPVCAATKGAAFYPLLNAMGYSLHTMGNALLLPYGPPSIQAAAKRAKFPVLAANCRDKNGLPLEGLRERFIFDLPGGVKLGVIGMAPVFNNFYEVFGLHLLDMLEAVAAQVEQLQREGAQRIVLLSHLGLREDRQIAESVTGIDLIIGGHSHSLLPEGEAVNGVLIAQAGEYAGALGRVDLEIEPGSGRLLSRTARVLPVPDDEPLDPCFEAALAEARQEVEQVRSQVLGVLEGALDLDHFGECGIGNLAADALCEHMGGEIGLVSAGQFHNGLPAGPVTVGQLNDACFTGANPYLSAVRGEQILAALERGLDPAIYDFFHHGNRGTPIGVPQVSGLQVWFDPQAETGQRVRRVLFNGELLDPQRIYRLAHTDAESMDDLGYLILQPEQEIHNAVPMILGEVLADYIRHHSPVPIPQTGRWSKTSTA